MRHNLLAVFACLSVFLTAATPAFTIVPTVIVYPLASSTTIDRETLARIGTTLATQIAVGGAVKVIPPNSGVDRQNYLSDARAAGANFYVTGFLTPLGNGASVVEQVVSTSSGTMVFSVTNYITNLADIASTGDQLRGAIIERSTSGLAAFAAPQAPANTPAPEASNGPDFNVTKLLGKKAPGAAAVAVVPPENATLAILTVGGSADFDQRAATAHALAGAFENAGRHAVLVDAGAPSNAVCSANKATAVVAAWIDTPPPPNVATANSALRMIAYDCNGNVAFDKTFKQPLAGVTNAAVSAYLNPPKRRV